MRTLALVGAVGVATMLLAAPLGAGSQSIPTLDPTEATAGSPLTVSGTCVFGQGSGETIVAQFVQNGQLVGTVGQSTTGSGGAYEIQGTVPSDAAVGAAVVRTICAGVDIPNLECDQVNNTCADFTVLADDDEAVQPAPQTAAPQVTAAPHFTG